MVHKKSLVQPTANQIISHDDVKRIDSIRNQKGPAPNQGWGRIMSYYNPKWMAVLTFFFGILNSFAFPVLGLIQAKFQYILFEAYYGDPNFVKQRNEWITYWACGTILVAIVNACERALIGVMGENLTFKVRKELMRGILYK